LKLVIFLYFLIINLGIGSPKLLPFTGILGSEYPLSSLPR
jgi:hypothetical protein